MKNNEKLRNLNVVDIFFKFYFLSYFIILLFLILFEYTSLEYLIERAKDVFGFWLILFLCFFLPRRILKKSKSFRYIILYLRKHYVFLFEKRWNFSIYHYFLFIIYYIRFYLERILKYLLIGTKIKWLNPYRINWMKNEIILIILEQIILMFQYIIIYIFKIFYEIIIFFDESSILKIIKSRILGFVMITVGYIIIGIKFYIYYILLLLSIFIIWNILNIYFKYKIFEKETPELGILYNLNSAFVTGGFAIRVETLAKIDILELRTKALLTHSVIKLKRLLNHNYYNFYRKYGGKETTKYLTRILSLTKVEKESKIYIDFFKKEFPHIKTIEIENISWHQFITRFLEKKEWYENMNINISGNNYKNNFESSILFFNNSFINILHFKVNFLYGLISQPSWDIENKLIEEDWWKMSNDINNYYYKYLSKYFEFNDIMKFINELEKKMKEYGGSIELYKQIYIKNGIPFYIAGMNSTNDEDKLEGKSLEFIKYIIGLYIYLKLDMNLFEKEFKEIKEINKYYKNELEILKSTLELVKEENYLKNIYKYFLEKKIL